MNNKPKTGKGGYRPGSGRKKGKMEQPTIDRMAVIAAYRERVAKHADTLFNAQLANAVGNIYIYRVDREENGKKRHILVSDPAEINKVLDQNAGESGFSDGEYYIITTEKPDNKSIDSMLDRAFGKAVNTIVTEDEQGNKKPVGTITIE